MFNMKPIPTEKCDIYAYAVLAWEVFTQVRISICFWANEMSNIPMLSSNTVAYRFLLLESALARVQRFLTKLRRRTELC